jgi:class 3 adenylate cyclase
MNGEALSPDNRNQSISIDKLLEELERINSLIRDRYTKNITVMFTDLKGSTSITEARGDIFSRGLIKRHNDVVLPLISSNKGTLVKTMGDGTLSFFEDPADAVRAAIRIQKDLNSQNLCRDSDIRIELRIGLNTGTGIVEPNDIFGDVVNVAARFQSLADPGGIVMSESTFKAIKDMDEFYCRHVKTTMLKGKKDPFRIFKVFWDETEIEKDRSECLPQSAENIASDVLFPSSIYTLAPPGDAAHEAATEDSVLVQKTTRLLAVNEILELFLFCEEFIESSSIQRMYATLRHDLETSARIETHLQGDKAFWFYRESISVGRTPDADLPLTNQALPRIRNIIGIRGGTPFLRSEDRGTGNDPKLIIRNSAGEAEIKPNIEYPLGKTGEIVIATCFPLAYRVHRERFLVLTVMNPEECIKKQFNIRLEDIWKNFPAESERRIIIGR